MVKRIVLTGGPCGGKTTFTAKARQWLEDRGVAVAVCQEGATELILAGVPPWTVRDIVGWQTLHGHHCMRREDTFAELLEQRLQPGQIGVLLCDRGPLDSAAFLDDDQFRDMQARMAITDVGLRERYDAVVFFITAALGADKYYTLANNEARTEAPADAVRVDRKLLSVWTGHPHLFILDNTQPFEDKIERGLQAMARVVGVPEPLEIERKFLVLENVLPVIDSVEDARVTWIEQTYLEAPDGFEERVRLRRTDGTTTFYFTVKMPTERPGERIERERQISEEEYVALLERPKLGTITKTRFQFVRGAHQLELDVYDNLPLIVLEVEVRAMDEIIDLPNWRLIEVTGQAAFSNAALATLPEVHA